MAVCAESNLVLNSDFFFFFKKKETPLKVFGESIFRKRNKKLFKKK